MKVLRKRIRSLGVLLAGAGLLVPVLASATTYSGRSFGLLVDPPLLGPTIVCDTGELPSSGGNLTDLVNNASISLSGQVVGATRVNCITAGAAVTASATAQIEGLQCTLNQLLVTTTLAASAVTCEAIAACGGLSGSAVITDLTIGGVAVTVTGQANQVVQIPGIATLVINEQIKAAGEITVNALHLTLLDGTECIIGGVHADIHECPPLPTEPSTWGKVKALYM